MKIEHPLRTAINQFIDACDTKERLKAQLEEDRIASFGYPAPTLKSQYRQAKQIMRAALGHFQDEWRAFKNNEGTKI